MMSEKRLTATEATWDFDHPPKSPLQACAEFHQAIARGFEYTALPGWEDYGRLAGDVIKWQQMNWANTIVKAMNVIRAAKAYRDLKTAPEPDTEKLMYAFSSLDEALKALEEGE